MLTRRDLLKSSAAAGAGLLVGGYLDGLRFALPAGADASGYGPLLNPTRPDSSTSRPGSATTSSRRPDARSPDPAVASCPDDPTAPRRSPASSA